MKAISRPMKFMKLSDPQSIVVLIYWLDTYSLAHQQGQVILNTCICT